MNLRNIVSLKGGIRIKITERMENIIIRIRSKVEICPFLIEELIFSVFCSGLIGFIQDFQCFLKDIEELLKAI